MQIHKLNPIRDKKWKNAQQHEPCIACGAEDGTVVGAHIRTGSGAGTGMKPSDSLILPMCYACHSHSHNIGEVPYWMEVVQADPYLLIEGLKALAEKRYREWLNE